MISSSKYVSHNINKRFPYFISGTSTSTYEEGGRETTTEPPKELSLLILSGQELSDLIYDLRFRIEILQDQIINLMEQQKRAIIYEFDKIPNERAKSMIIDHLKHVKKEKTIISVFEISQKLKLPADQVEMIVEELAKDKRVSIKNE